MAQHLLYLYFVGCEFSDFAESAVARIDEFLEATKLVGKAWTVNQPRIADDGVAEWDLGVALELPDRGQEPADWFAQVEAVVAFGVQLRQEFGNDLIVGIADARRGCAEDIIEIADDPPDIEYLKRFLSGSGSCKTSDC